ncbi:hypothetical protein T484DRAFT_1776805 [Baffinella frigidus]|nr:hypothetical protein T484DRAFT_1776805 [Cryptophyta sp. CCMP2293]
MKNAAALPRVLVALSVLIGSASMLRPATAAAHAAKQLPAAFLFHPAALPGLRSNVKMTTIHRGIHLGSLGGLGPRRVEVPAARASAPGAPQLIRNGRMALFGAAGGSAIPLMRAGLPGAGRRHSTVKGSTLQSLLSEQVQGGSVSPRAHPDKVRRTSQKISPSSSGEG